MSNNKFKNDFTKMQLEKVLLKEKVKVLMPDEILNKIKYLCKSIPKVEWSGILFYSIRGSIKTPSDMEITLEDILPMHMGTMGYTEYEIDRRYVDYMMDNPEAMKWYMGHIHSHNTMNVFFSGVDMSELNDNTDSHNFYLSLIVNNFMDFCAKVAFRASINQEVKDISYMGKDENGNLYCIEKKDLVLKREKMFIYDCEIFVPREQVIVDDSFAKKVHMIKSVKPEPVKTVPVQQIKQHYPPLKHNPLKQSMKKEELPSDVEIFVMSLLNFSTIPGDDDDIVDLLADIDELDISGTILSGSIADNLASVYERQFPHHQDNVEHFLDVISETILILEEHEKDFPVVYQTIGMLKEMIFKFEAHDITR